MYGIKKDHFVPWWFSRESSDEFKSKSIQFVTVSLIGLKYPQILNWLYDITVVVRIVVVQTNLGRAMSTFSPNPSDAEKSSVDRMAANYMRLLQWLRRHLPKDVWAPLHKLRSKHLGPDYLWLRPPTFWPCCPYKGANNIQPELRSRVTTWVLPFLNRKGHSVRRASAN